MRHQITYLIGEAFRGLRHSHFLSLTSFLTIGICSAILATVLVGAQLILKLTRSSDDATVLRVFVLPDHEEKQALQRLEERILRTSGVSSANLISKDQALEEFRDEFDAQMVEMLDVNPLPFSFLIHPTEEYRSGGQNELLHQRLERLEGVEAVSSNTLYLSWLEKWRLPSLALASFLIVFIGGALAIIIHNAIKRSLYARKSLVENMKYCGANELFITAPFLLEGLLLGSAGSLLGVFLLFFIQGGLRYLFPSAAAQIAWASMAWLILIIGSGIAMLASARTVRHFIRESRA